MPVSSSCPTISAIGRLASFLRAGGDPAQIEGSVADLRTFLEKVPDPRARRGVRHPLTSILLIAATAVAAGARSFTAIGEWAADASQHLLHQLGARFATRHQLYLAPDEATVRRVYKMLKSAEYKRRQAPPGVKITRRAFGRDRRYPITNAFQDSGPTPVQEPGETPRAPAPSVT